MEAARKLRERDSTVMLVFLTALAQCAIQGYEVQAAAYILKPVSPSILEMKLRRLLPRCERSERSIALEQAGRQVFISQDDLMLVEIYDHHIQYYTALGIFRDYGTLKKVEEQLPQETFYRVNNQTIVNLRHVKGIGSENVIVGDREYPISSRRKKGFIEALHRVKTGR